MFLQPDVIHQGSIPACAGEPVAPTARPETHPVYPRVCGGTEATDSVPYAALGLSPRVRGNPTSCPTPSVRIRSIPACAGEPLRGLLDLRIRWVYPRVCGGTLRRIAADYCHCGLSPRVRGNPRRFLRRRPTGGSIPACAGEPGRVVGDVAPYQVYPRVCGGTRQRILPMRPHLGLSPRVRGNLTGLIALAGSFRSIPACAGEPRRAGRPPTPAEVYPRVCGGTCVGSAGVQQVAGLSPRVRGNRCPSKRGTFCRRSIPACAGEPVNVVDVVVLFGVYPRVCGGTYDAQADQVRYWGLSPRVRGNLNKGKRGKQRISVPGLSPRVRGNRLDRDRQCGRRRSIPACAGEPVTIAVVPIQHEVYPRVCGGTRLTGAVR